MNMQAKSKAMPFLMAPPALDGTMAGDVGFDPLWVSSMLPDAGWLPWLREAELKHGRVAMLAATGAIVQDLVQFKGTETLTGGAKMTGLHDVFLAKELPGAAGNVATFHQMLLWLGIFELASYCPDPPHTQPHLLLTLSTTASCPHAAPALPYMYRGTSLIRNTPPRSARSLACFFGRGMRCVCE